MGIAKSELLNLIDNLPEEIDIDELMYRLYLKKRLSILRKILGKIVLSRMKMLYKETEKWFRK